MLKSDGTKIAAVAAVSALVIGLAMVVLHRPSQQLVKGQGVGAPHGQDGASRLDSVANTIDGGTLAMGESESNESGQASLADSLRRAVESQDFSFEQDALKSLVTRSVGGNHNGGPRRFFMDGRKTFDSFMKILETEAESREVSFAETELTAFLEPYLEELDYKESLLDAELGRVACRKIDRGEFVKKSPSDKPQPNAALGSQALRRIGLFAPDGSSYHLELSTMDSPLVAELYDACRDQADVIERTARQYAGL